MRLSAEVSLKKDYELDPDVLREIKEKKGEGWVFVHAEDGLKRSRREIRLRDVAMQCACGNIEDVEMGEVDAIRRTTGKKVKLALFFVEKWQYRMASQQRERERRRRLERVNWPISR